MSLPIKARPVLFLSGHHPMESLPYQIINGRLFIEPNGIRALVSTGTADSMCTCGEILIEGKSFPVKQQSLRTTPAALAKAVDTPLDALLGADILSHFDYRINPFRKEIAFSTEEIHPYGYAAHLNLYRSVPIISVWIEAHETPVFFNTGAKTSLFIPEITLRFPQVGVSREFYPGIGWFETPLHRILIWMSGNDVELDVGIPPASLITTLQSTHTLGVLGSDIFKGPGVFLASRRREVIWFWHDY
jgi:hypothetical protein